MGNDVELVEPEAQFEPTKARENDGENMLPTDKSHLLCDAQRGVSRNRTNPCQIDRLFESNLHRQYIDFQLAIRKWKLPEAPPRAGFFAMGSRQRYSLGGPKSGLKAVLSQNLLTFVGTVRRSNSDRQLHTHEAQLRT